MKKILRLVFLYATMLLLSCGAKVKKTAQVSEISAKPNVLFIIADDLGLNDVSFTGSTYYETPNIDGIAKEGTVFTQGYAGSRVCSPSRASIMLGQFTARHKITDWIGAASGEQWRKQGHNDKILPAEYLRELPKADTTLADAMRAAGYKTFFTGKWHLGDKGSYPEDHGFDINKGGWDSGSPSGGYFSPWDNPSLPNDTPGENLSMRLAKETNIFLEQNQKEAFFAFLSFYAVHGPIQTDQPTWGKYRDKAEKMGIADHGFEMERVLPIRTQQDNPVYAGLVEQMDNAVGLVLEQLKALGLDKNTIIIFTSDNGGVASGDAFSTTNRPLRGGKGYQWEGGVREPYFIKVPFIKNAPKTIENPVTGADFYPTILDLANLDLKPSQHADGVSLKALLEGKKIADRPLYWHYPHYGNQGGEPSSMIRKGDHKLIHYYEDGHDELYDLKADPGEHNDLAKQNTAFTSEMRDQLDRYLKKVNANMPSLDPDYDAAKDAITQKQRKENLLPRLEKERVDMLSKNYEPNPDWWGSKVTKD